MGCPSVLPPLPGPIRRKVFVSYYSGDQTEVEDFLYRWTEQERVFIPKALGVSDRDDLINSDDAEYVMSQIRERHLGDSTVTLVMVGRCTHSRRYIDWEVKSSLRQGRVYTPNGLAGIILPSCGNQAWMPPRLEANWRPRHVDCYARYWTAPRTADDLRSIIEDAYGARTARSYLVQNSAEMMKYNARCRVCGVTH